MKRFIYISLSLFLLVACSKKYEEGPAFSLRSKEQRIANQWEIESAVISGQNITSEFRDIRFTFDKFGNAEANIIIDATTDVHLEGKWQFKDDDETLHVDVEGDSLGQHADWETDYTILRLKESELKIRNQVTNVELLLTPF